MTSALEIFQPFLGWGDFSDIYLEESTSLSIRWENGNVESLSASEQSGAGLRYLQGLETRFGHTDLAHPLEGNLSRDELERLSSIQNQLTGEKTPHPWPPPLSLAGELKIEGLDLSKRSLADISFSSPPGDRPRTSLSSSPRRGEARRGDSLSVHSIRIDPRTVVPEEKINLLKRAFEAACAGGPVRQVAINYGEKTKNIFYLNSLGESFSEERVYTVLSLIVTVERNRDFQTAYDSMGGLLGYELFDGTVVEEMAAQVAERARKKLEAPPAPVGPMPVVIASSAGGTLIHEAVGHSLEADAVLEGTSPSYIGKLGKVVGNEKLNVFDDPTVPTKRGSFHFDDEGVPSERTHLIENGVLKNYLYDRLSAKRAGVTSNGHGRRESYAHQPIPRMSNTFVASGKDDPKKILDSFKNGFLVTKMGGGQVNTANGDFVFDVEEGFAVKDGKKTLVRGATLLGNGPQVLMDIEEIGSDHGWAIGTCGKEGQGVPVSDALPTVKIKTLVVGGGGQ